MARPLRIERAGGWYHVTSRGNERKAIFRDDRDRRHFLELLAEVVERFRIRLHVYVLMGNHYHLVLELAEANLSRATQWLNLSYSVWFNRRHGRSGHLFQGRFKSVVVSRDAWALELSRYVHLNPVRTQGMGMGKRQRAAQRLGLGPAPNAEQVQRRVCLLRQYRWSSYPAYAGWAVVPKWLECQTVLGLGGGLKSERGKRYRDYVEQALREGLERSPWESLREQVVLGGVEFLKELRERIGGHAQEQRGARRLLAERPGLAQVVKAVETVKGEPWEAFRDRYGDTGRDMVLYLGRWLCGMKLRDLAEAAEMRNDAVVATNAIRYEKRMKESRAEQATVRKVLELLKCKM